MFLYIPPKECYSLFWQESARSQGTTFTLRSSCQHWGIQAPRTQLAPRFLRLPEQLGPSHTHCIPCRRLLPWGHRDRDRGERVTTTSRPGSGQSGGLGEKALEPCRTQLPALLPWAPSSPTDPKLGELEDLREKAGIRLISHSLPGRTTIPLTSGWIAHQQWLLESWLGWKGPLWPRPMAKQDH